MKKIGIATIFRTGNYGGTLQAYALKEAINTNGFGNAEIINYCCDAIKGKIDFKYLKKAGLLKTIAALVDKACYAPRMKKMNHFIDSFVDTTEIKKEELPCLNDKYDIFLSGSDQLWNPDIQQEDFFYLLDFVVDAKKKKSYASSFGIRKIPEHLKEKYKYLLSNYSEITVREEAGAELVYQLLGIHPKIVLDPTLLLTPQHWIEIMPENKKKKGKYIFVYRLTYSSKLTQVAQVLQKRLNCHVVSAPFLLGVCHKNRMKPNLSSLEWAGEIYNSEFVITDSFHGVVFSIIFSKQFYYMVTTQTAKERLSRVETLLSSLEISNRIINNADECKFEEIIDYEIVHKRLREQRDVSLVVLREMLS